MTLTYELIKEIIELVKTYEERPHILNNYPGQHIKYRATSLKKAENILEYLESIGILVDIKT